MCGILDMERVKAWGMPVSSMDKFISREMERVLEMYKQGDGVE